MYVKTYMAWPIWSKSCHNYEWVMSHTWTSHVTHTWQVLKPMQATRTAPRCDAHTFIHTYMHKYKHVHVHTWRACTHAQSDAKRHVYMFALHVTYKHTHARTHAREHARTPQVTHACACACLFVCARVCKWETKKSKRSPSGWRQPIGFFVLTHLFSNITPTGLSSHPKKSKICGIQNSYRNLSFSFEENKCLSNQ